MMFAAGQAKQVSMFYVCCFDRMQEESRWQKNYFFCKSTDAPITKKAFYCSQECQKQHWGSHMYACAAQKAA